MTYGESVDRAVVGDQLTGDHIPSYAAIRRNVETTLGAPLNEEQAMALRDNTNVVVIGDDLHADGRTFFSKNTRSQIAADATDLNSAALKDQATHLQNAAQYGYNETELQQSFGVLNQRNQSLFFDLSTKEGVVKFFNNLGVEVDL